MFVLADNKYSLHVLKLHETEPAAEGADAAVDTHDLKVCGVVYIGYGAFCGLCLYSCVPPARAEVAAEHVLSALV